MASAESDFLLSSGVALRVVRAILTAFGLDKTGSGLSGTSIDSSGGGGVLDTRSAWSIRPCMTSWSSSRLLMTLLGDVCLIFAGFPALPSSAAAFRLGFGALESLDMAEVAFAVLVVCEISRLAFLAVIFPTTARASLTSLKRGGGGG